ncbi:recombinase family protein [Streptomyces sp. NRAIS4]
MARPGRRCRLSWIPAQHLAGHSIARIARASNASGIPCPGAADRARNRHRNGQRWVLNTVRAILAHPRYTGRRVWNRRRTDHGLVDPANTTLGHRDVMRWSATGATTVPHLQHLRPRRPCPAASAREEILLGYDPATSTLTADTPQTERITIS